MPKLKELNCSYCFKEFEINNNTRNIEKLICLGMSKVPKLSKLRDLICDASVDHRLNKRKSLFDKINDSLLLRIDDIDLATYLSNDIVEYTSRYRDDDEEDEQEDEEDEQEEDEDNDSEVDDRMYDRDEIFFKVGHFLP